MNSTAIIVIERSHLVKNQEGKYEQRHSFSVEDIIRDEQSIPMIIKTLADREEPGIEDFFGGADYTRYVDIIKGKEDYSTGCEFVDKMGQQAVLIFAVYEDAMLNRIKWLTDSSTDGVLDITNFPGNIYTAMAYPGDGYLHYEFLPKTIQRRDYEDEDGYKDVIYDATFITRPMGTKETLYYTESIAGDLDWALLYAIYRLLISEVLP